MSQGDEFERTIAYGEQALRSLRENVLPAYPRYYEFWYTYSAGLNQQLNRALNAALRENGTVTREDIDKLYVDLLSPTRYSDQVEQIGDKLAREIATLDGEVRRIDSTTSAYGTTLDGATKALGLAKDPEAIAKIITRLTNETDRVARANRELSEKLAESKKQVDELRTNLDTVRHDSQTDTLTGIGNRKLFDQTITSLARDAGVGGGSFALLMTDVDHFKKFNDTFGHQTGDQVLRLVAAAVKASIKGGDIAARYGGEEFAVLLPSTTLDQAMQVGENIRAAVMAKELVKRSTGERLGRVTLSVGCSFWHDADSIASMIERADAALYAAKRGGRNCVRSERDLMRAVA